MELESHNEPAPSPHQAASADYRVAKAEFRAVALVFFLVIGFCVFRLVAG